MEPERVRATIDDGSGYQHYTSPSLVRPTFHVISFTSAVFIIFISPFPSLCSLLTENPSVNKTFLSRAVCAPERHVRRFVIISTHFFTLSVNPAAPLPVFFVP